MENDEVLVSLIIEAINNAKENGYDVLSMSDEELTNDLIDYDSDIQDFSHEEVLECIPEVRQHFNK